MLQKLNLKGNRVSTERKERIQEKIQWLRKKSNRTGNHERKSRVRGKASNIQLRATKSLLSEY